MLYLGLRRGLATIAILCILLRMEPFKNLTEDEIAYLLAHAEFPESVRKAGEKVAVIMTQGWCHEWADMQQYLPEFTGEVTVYALVYDLRSDFEEIMAFKENVLGNLEIPYVRFYRSGELITTTNWLPKATFAALLKRDKPFTVLRQASV
jgi:hypothetical protein